LIARGLATPWFFALAFAATVLGCHGLALWVTTPGDAFEARRAPSPPDYTDASSWAALPAEASRANSVPPHSGAVDAQAGAAADVFFVHPTTYFWRRHWNAPCDGWRTRAITGATVAGQASAFNGTARIYAPRYRQMTLPGFRDAAVREAALGSGLCRRAPRLLALRRGVVRRTPGAQRF